jgi:hypothetical protein
MNCNAPGPDGLRCENYSPDHPSAHWQGFGPGAWATWWPNSPRPTYGGPVFDMLREMGACLRSLGEAWRAR